MPLTAWVMARLYRYNTECRGGTVVSTTVKEANLIECLICVYRN